jgi:hypothetical protein
LSAGTTEAALARYAAGECSLVELGRVLGATRREARAALERTGISVRHPGRPSGSSRLAGILTEDYLRREVLGRRRGVADVAAEVGCTPKTVRRYLRASGIVDRAPAAGIVARAPAARIVDRAPTAGIVDRALGGAAPNPVPRRDGFRPAGASGDGAKASGTGLSREALWDAYIVRASSTTAIAAAAGCAPSTVGRDLRRNGITLRRRGGAPAPAVRLGRRRAGIRRAVQAADS